MKLTEILLVALIGSSTSLASHAKEVELVKFGSPRPLSKNALPIDLAGAADLSETIAKSLRIQFEAFPSRWSLATDLPFVREQVNRQARIDQPTVIMQFRQASCDGVDYVPTWWLPRAAERRRAQYFGVMADIACEHGLPTSLLDAVIAQESGFKSWAVSSAGAVGLMQIMPRTGRMLGLTAPYDPVANMRAGARYLRQQFDRFDRVDLALAAYNAGPERRALKRSQIPAIPETINYVRTIMTNWTRLAQLGQLSGVPINRGQVALTAIRASGYREVEFIRYDGLNSANPM